MKKLYKYWEESKSLTFGIYNEEDYSYNNECEVTFGDKTNALIFFTEPLILMQELKEIFKWLINQKDRKFNVNQLTKYLEKQGFNENKEF